MNATAKIGTAAHAVATRARPRRRLPAWAWSSATSAPARSTRSTSPPRPRVTSGAVSPEAVLGIVSLIFWSLIIVISIKYAILIMRADNHGEGGILALLALVSPRRARAERRRAIMVVVGLIGATLLYGDGAITPAISVLSAIEGLKVYAPQLASLVVPLTVAILVVLFVIQRKGTAFIGGIFGPVMLLWFIVIGLLGVAGIVERPAILAALSPLPAIDYLWHAGPIAFAVIGGAFLAVTGGEAFYADMGHFGPLPIRARLVRRRAAGARRSTTSARAACCSPPGAHRQSLLSARAAMVALRAGGARDGGHRDCLAVDHLRRLFADPAGDSARLSAAHERGPHRRPARSARSTCRSSTGRWPPPRSPP